MRGFGSEEGLPISVWTLLGFCLFFRLQTAVLPKGTTLKSEHARLAHRQWPTGLLLTSLAVILGGCSGDKVMAGAGATTGTGGRGAGSGGTAGMGPTQLGGGGSGGMPSGISDGGDTSAGDAGGLAMCTGDSGCGGGHICVNGQCLPAECVVDSDCGSGQICLTSRCGAKPCNPPKTHFSVSINGASTVNLAGAFNGWSPTATPMTLDAHAAMWTVDVSLDAGTYPYKFVVTLSDTPVDGGGPNWIADPANPETAPDGFGGLNSLITIICDGVAPPDGGVGSIDAPPATDAGTDTSSDRAADAATDASVDSPADVTPQPSADSATGS